jgi:hypothetical protein
MAFGPTFYPSTADASDARMVEVEPAKVPMGVDVTLRRAPLSRVRGKVVRFGQPAVGATVVLGEITSARPRASKEP